MSAPVLIAGAGIGGLVSALCLARAGLETVLLERAPVLEEIGAGIQLSPNASHILLRLGLGPALDEVSVRPEALVVSAGSTGRAITRLPLGAAIEARHGAPYLVVHRGALQRILLDALAAEPSVHLHLGTEVREARETARSVALVCSGGRFFEGAVLIGADGVWSHVRTAILGRAPARYCGRTAWRAMIAADDVPAGVDVGVTALHLGRDAHVVHYPIDGGARLNIVAILAGDWRGEGWNRPDDGGPLLDRLRGWAPALRALIARPSAWRMWALCEVDPTGPWARDRIGLLGDAAHAMVPFLAQGGAMAIEDAAVLAAALAREPRDPASALRAYVRARRLRVERVWHAARTNGHIYHLAGPAARLRDAGLGMLGAKALAARYDWLYEWRAPSWLAAPTARGR